ncbi:MAG: exodeoxyribonuclease VII large subunit [Candidatus Nomurabacteria bacterium]|nr:MAG: exodeoxyribonuclease VII large subunit [Candidatus Nomurabacteria bacterium]
MPEMRIKNAQRIYSVHELVQGVRELLKQAVGVVTVQGEVTAYREPKGNLVYFEIKDAKSAVLCFAMTWEMNVPIENGMEVQVVGYPSLFQRRGSFHFKVMEIRPVGAGAIQQALEKLKAKLEGEGLFSEARKRALPRFPESIGLITSPDAAAYNDVLRVLGNRWGGADIHFAPVPVQGTGSANHIVAALRGMQSLKPDVIILTRGGGSIEDLHAFNDEQVARAVFASEVPVICGVGHERDWTIADLVADKRAATPSNAAELAVPDRREINFALDAMLDTIDVRYTALLRAQEARIQEAIQSILDRSQVQTEELRNLLQVFTSSFRRFSLALSQADQELSHLASQQEQGFMNMLTSWRQRVEHSEQLLISLSPQSTLDRGYSITRDAKTGAVIRNAKGIQKGQRIRTQVHQGNIDSTVNTSHT